jgi:hypothetical protein
MANNNAAVVIVQLEDAIKAAKEKPANKQKVMAKISLALAAADSLQD